MNPETNEFYEAAEPINATHIPFTIGEELTIKGHIFKVAHIKMAPHRLILVPIRVAREESSGIT